MTAYKGLDKLDTRLLAELMKNSRTPVTQLAKKLKVSREVANYRLNNLIKNKIILNFVTEINIEKLGYAGAAVFINVKATKQKEFREFLDKCGFVSWVAEHSGVWNYGLSIIGRTNEELDKKFLVLYNKFKNDILNHRFTLHRKSTFFYEKYFSNVIDEKKEKQKGKIKKANTTHKADNKDKIILKELSKNSRIDSVELSKKIKLTAPAVANRIKQLEKAGFIQKYSIFLDITKLNMYQYSIFIINKNMEQKGKLLSYLKHHKKVSFIAEYIGDPFMEFGIYVDNPYKLRDILQEIEESFPDNRIMEFSLFQKEFISVGPPDCVFE